MAVRPDPRRPDAWRGTPPIRHARRIGRVPRLGLHAAAAATAALLSAPACADEPRLRPTALLDLDAGRWLDRPWPDDDRGGVEPRRARLGVEARLRADLELSAIWDFGGTPGSRSNLYEARAQWRPADGPAALTAGVFKPRFALENTQSSSQRLFLELPAIVDAAAGVAAGTRRIGVQAQGSGERWLAAAALTGRRTGEDAEDAQRGALLRLAGLPVRTDAVSLHVGASAAWSRRTADTPGLSLSPSPELEVGRGESPLGTGRLRADRARAAGLELGLGWDRLWMQGERFVVDADGPDGSPRFDGGYAQLAWTLAGSPRRWSSERAVWSVPEGARRGTVEAGLRLSTVDLDDAGTLGGRQRTWSLAIAGWVDERLRLALQLQQGRIEAEGATERFAAVAVRAQLEF